MLKRRVIELDQALGRTDEQGFIETGVPGVTFFRSTRPVPRAPLLYQSGLVIIGQGSKTGYLDGERFLYDAENYLIVSVPLPFECETRASPDAPLLGIFVDIDPALLQEMVAIVEADGPMPATASSMRRGVEPVPLEGPMLEATARLLRTLQHPLDARMLGQARVREVVYRALQGPHGPALAALTRHQSPYARVARALTFAHGHYDAAIGVKDLARAAAMSTSAFHRAFKVVTGQSPLQYVKQIRLNKAFSLLVHAGLTVRESAFAVGYESPSQFSREFKRYFGLPPSQADRADGASIRTYGHRDRHGVIHAGPARAQRAPEMA